MYVEWTETALNALSQIKSKYYSKEETAEYKERLVLEILVLICSIKKARSCFFQKRHPLATHEGKLHHRQ